MEPSLSSSILPADLLLEISARSDPVTLVRCTATCKALRRQIADPAFHHCLRLLHADRFVSMLLLGLFIENAPDGGLAPAVRCPRPLQGAGPRAVSLIPVQVHHPL